MITKEQLIGTCSLVSYTMEKEDGTVCYPLGKDCKAYLIYTADGHVSAQMSRPGRKAYESGSLHDGKMEEMAAAAHGYMTYCGTYLFQPEKSCVIHNIEISMNPLWENMSQTRNVDFDGTYLNIFASINGASLIWKKSK